MSALVVGALIAQPGAHGRLIVAALACAALVVTTFELPIVTFGGLAMILAVASEDDSDDGILSPVREAVFDAVVSAFSLPVVLLALLALVLGLTLGPEARAWPGAPATLALALLVIAAGYAIFLGPFGPSLYVVRPVLVLVLAILVGYWTALRYGVDLPLKLLVGAAIVAIPIGLYNAASGDLSYYDGSFVYLIGVAGVLVLFRAIEIGFLRWPFLVLSALVIILSLRRGVMLAIAITVLIAGVLAGAGTFRTLVAVVAVAVIGVELLVPGTVVSPIEGVVNYFTGASGQDFSVNYRRYEQTNAWMNVERNWIWGIGPTAEWTQYRTFDGKFERINGTYLHNSYLWVWLRFGLFGLVGFVLFLVVSALSLLRRNAPVTGVVVGASIVGLIVTLATASYLTTTVRWPLVVGLFVGIALAARREADARAATAGTSVPYARPQLARS